MTNKLTLALLLSTVASFATETPAKISDEDIEKAVINMLKKDPKPFIDAMNEGMQKQQVAARQDLEKTVATKLEDLKKASLRIGKEDKNGILAFIDPMCPYCQKWVEEVLKVNDVTFHILPIPLLSNDTSNMVGKMMILAHKQDPDKFKKFLSLYHSDPAKMNKETLLKAATTAGLDAAKIEKSIDDKDLYKENTKFMEDLKVQSVPTIFVFKGDKVAHMPPMDAETMQKAFKEFVEGKLDAKADDKDLKKEDDKKEDKKEDEKK